MHPVHKVYLVPLWRWLVIGYIAQFFYLKCIRYSRWV